MRIVFMGTPEFSAIVLEELIERHEVLCVYTRPDAIRGRGKGLVPSPVKVLAAKHEIEVRTPKSLRNADEQAYLKGLAPDVICVAAYGALLPAEVLSIPVYGCLNVHASLLPRWRGAAPIERAILAGDEETGVCIMRMEEGLDTGPWCVCRTCAIENKSLSRLTDELASLGAQALITALVHVEQGAVEWNHQDEALATYAEKIAKGELNLSPAESADLNARKVQASSDAHGSRAVIAEKPATVLEARRWVPGEHDDVSLDAGQVRFVRKKLLLGCSNGLLEVISLKPDGKRAMAASAFAAGIPALHTSTSFWEELCG